MNVGWVKRHDVCVCLMFVWILDPNDGSTVPIGDGNGTRLQVPYYMMSIILKKKYDLVNFILWSRFYKLAVKICYSRKTKRNREKKKKRKISYMITEKKWTNNKKFCTKVINLIWKEWLLFVVLHLDRMLKII